MHSAQNISLHVKTCLEGMRVHLYGARIVIFSLSLSRRLCLALSMQPTQLNACRTHVTFAGHSISNLCRVSQDSAKCSSIMTRWVAWSIADDYSFDLSLDGLLLAGYPMAASPLGKTWGRFISNTRLPIPWHAGSNFKRCAVDDRVASPMVCSCDDT